jgi:hypothetical protein
MLKTLVNMVASQNVARDGNRITSVLHPRVGIAILLQDGVRELLENPGMNILGILRSRRAQTAHIAK